MSQLPGTQKVGLRHVDRTHHSAPANQKNERRPPQHWILEGGVDIMRAKWVASTYWSTAGANGELTGWQ